MSDRKCAFCVGSILLLKFVVIYFFIFFIKSMIFCVYPVSWHQVMLACSLHSFLNDQLCTRLWWLMKPHISAGSDSHTWNEYMLCALWMSTKRQIKVIDAVAKFVSLWGFLSFFAYDCNCKGHIHAGEVPQVWRVFCYALLNYTWSQLKVVQYIHNLICLPQTSSTRKAEDLVFRWVSNSLRFYTSAIVCFNFYQPSTTEGK